MTPDDGCSSRTGADGRQQPDQECVAIHVSARELSSQTLRRPPRNFLSRDGQRRLFWTVMPPATLVVLFGLWIEHSFFRQPSARPPQQVDTRIPGGPRGMTDGIVSDAVVMEPDPEPFSEDPPTPRAVPTEFLEKVRDDTVFREADSDAWFALWRSLQERDPAEIDRTAGSAVGFTELFGQPRSFRGKPVRLRGTLRRLQRVEAAANTAGIRGYWQGWLDPEGGPPSPIVVYFLALPDSIQPGTRLVEPVEVVGYFFKRWAYQATDTIRTAPLVMALEPETLAAPPRPPEGNIASILLWTGGILSMFVFAVIMLRPFQRRQHRKWPGIRQNSRVLLVLFALAPLSMRTLAGPAEGEHGREPDSALPSMTIDDYLSRFDLAAADRRAIGPVFQWSRERFDAALRILTRLNSSSTELRAAWSREALHPTVNQDSDIEDMIRVIGQAVLVRDIPLPSDMAERHDRPGVSLVRIIDSDGIAVDVITGAAPKAWPRNVVIAEPADAVGILVTRDAGPSWNENLRSPDAIPPPPAMTLVSSRVSWRPGTPLGSLGMDYGLFDTVQDGRKLVAEDADAFYGMLAAAGRATREGLEAAASEEVDIFTLIDPQSGWIENHRGAAVRIRGIARRAIRVAIDSPHRRRQLGADHYWEVFVFVRTPSAVQVNGRLQDTYPFVCCFRELPTGMSTGERIAEDVDISGFVFKRYRYPLATRSAAGQPQESPLLISRSPRWIRETESVEQGQFDRVFGGVLIAVTLLLIGVGWAARQRPRHMPTPRPQIAPPPESASPTETSDG
jgi:hypothetical protein